MKSAIITGATGAIGMALINELIQHNIKVLVICREDSQRNNRIPEHPLVTKLLCSLDKLSQLSNVPGEKYDVLFHLAWAGTTGTARNDMELQNHNIEYSLDAVDLAYRFGCTSYVGVGSQAEYGLAEGKLTPDTPVHPIMAYGIAKLSAGIKTKKRAKQYNMHHVWARVLSVYGPYDGAQSMVMSCIYKLLDSQIPYFTKAEQMWDYLYSKDAARALYLLGEKKCDGVYCLGSGQVRQLREYIEIIRDMVDPAATVGIGELPYNPNQVMYLCADISDLTRDTGFEPEYSFEEGIKETIEYCKKKIVE